jgi:uncharacterized protein YdeI (YjbR/CyaY-like superfamily)
MPPMAEPAPDPIHFATPQDWSDWLAAHYASRTEVWLKMYRKSTGIPSIDWKQAVVEALCWGWIDGQSKPIDQTCWRQRFTPRRPRSTWSQINVAHVERLLAEGRMQPSGLVHVAAAKADGRWEAAYSGGKGADLPPEFRAAIAANPAAAAGLAALDSKNRYAIYHRLTVVKRPETRARKIAEYVALLAGGGKLF